VTARRLSLVGRISVASALAAALGGTGAALSAGVTARELSNAQEISHLLRASTVVAEEIAEELYGDDDDDGEEDEGPRSPSAILADEVADVKLEGAHAALWIDGRLAAGSTELPTLSPGHCTKLSLSDGVVRACSLRVGRAALLTLAVSTFAEESRAQLLLRALLVGIVGGALLGGLLSYVLARWAIAPLNALRDRVRQVRVEEPEPKPLAEIVAEPEIEELRAAIAKLIEQLAAALDHAQAFAAEAAHELRTPLTTIAGELELMSEDIASVTGPALLRVRAQVHALTLLVQRLLALAQSAPVAPNGAEVIDLSDVLAAAMETLSPNEVARVKSACQDDVLIRGDGSLLKSLLSNAIENALKFSSGEVEVAIARPQAEVAQIDVIDSGDGIRAAERERVFAPFYRSSAARASGTTGHGLGLALIAAVARRHHGRAEFLERAQGAHLRVTLPGLRVGPAAEDAKAQARKGSFGER
jgi:signal transduction histidine kinase